MKDNQTLVLVSDIHSQHQRLEAALEWIESEFFYFGQEYPQIVFLGDITDSRLDDYEKNYPPHSDPRHTFAIVRELVDNTDSILLQSNHQDKLRRWLHHNLTNPEKKNPVTTNYGLDYTLAQFVEPMTIEEKWDLHDWLVGLPYHVVVESYDLQHDCQTSFLCSHAYFNAFVDLQNPSKRHKQEALYGVLNPDNTRFDWWSPDQPISFYGQSAVRVGGYYHLVHRGNYHRVIDAGCGSTGGSLCVHVPAYDLYQEF